MPAFPSQWEDPEAGTAFQAGPVFFCVVSPQEIEHHMASASARDLSPRATRRETPPTPAGSSSEHGSVEYALRLVDGVAKRVAITETFTVMGKDFEIGERGFAHFVERVEHMAAVTERTSGVMVVGMRFERREPRPPFVRVEVRLEAYYLPIPLRY
ncbi:MAG TPA: hypothetical protein VLA19_28605 [Herpetosiphonaceae bacterium]|nr:hypothetical protein [Herpetosiphonaceae bacterium]